MDKIMMWVMAICALIGGVDQLAGNKFGLGRRFEDGFQLLCDRRRFLWLG